MVCVLLGMEIVFSADVVDAAGSVQEPEGPKMTSLVLILLSAVHLILYCWLAHSPPRHRSVESHHSERNKPGTVGLHLHYVRKSVGSKDCFLLSIVTWVARDERKVFGLASLHPQGRWQRNRLVRNLMIVQLVAGLLALGVHISHER